MGRARGQSSGRISVSRGRSIELPSDIQPILKEEGADVGQAGQLRDRIAQLEQQVQKRGQQLQSAQSEIESLRATNQQLQQQLRDTVPLSEARDAVQQAFNAGVQRVISFLKQRGIL